LVLFWNNRESNHHPIAKCNVTARWAVQKQEPGFMSISGATSNAWFPPWITQAGHTAAGSTTPAQPSETGTTAQSGTSTGDLFQQLASDIQAVLVQGQDGGTTQAATAAGTSTSPSDPTQQLVAALQAIYTQVQANQSGQSGSDPTQTSATGQADPTGHVHGGHHHHSHQADAASGSGDMSGDSADASSGNASTSGSVQSLSQVLAANIMQAIQAYASTTAATTVPGVTA
jgi:hypothetical protein